MNLITVSTKQLRENFSRVKSALEAGQSLLLLYRSQPLAEIKPAKKIQWIAADQLTPAPDISSLRGSIKPRSRPEDFKTMRQKFVTYLSHRNG